MKSLYLALIAVVALAGCSQTSRRSPDVAKDIRASLDHARFTDVSVSQDRDKGVVTLSGHVAGDRDKAQVAIDRAVHRGPTGRGE